MRPISHVIVSSGVTAILSVWVKSWDALAVCFLSGIFIDLDHHVDYFLARKEIPFSYRKLVDFCWNDHSAKIFLFLHSYELLITLWISIFVFDLNRIWVSAAIGMTIHILCDEIANPLRPLAYFFSYRAKNRFDRKYFFKKGYHE
jgi:hypothetical protein